MPNANYTVLGVNDTMIGRRMCRDAVAILLREVPEITGLTFRIHVEGGISEGDYDFWRQVFGAIREAGRPILIDMHAKGLDETTLNVGLETGMPVCVSPKYLAEHVGLAYHPSAIREREYPPKEEMSNREKPERRLASLHAAELRRHASGRQNLAGRVSCVAGHAASAGLG